VAEERRFRQARHRRVHRQSGYSQLLRRVGVQAALSPHSLEEEDRTPGANPVCDNQLWVLAAVVWADRGIVGQTIVLNNHDFTVIGIAPGRFTGSEVAFAPKFWGAEHDGILVYTS